VRSGNSGKFTSKQAMGVRRLESKKVPASTSANHPYLQGSYKEIIVLITLIEKLYRRKFPTSSPLVTKPADVSN
jgi:hypothetical protein